MLSKLKNRMMMMTLQMMMMRISNEYEQGIMMEKLHAQEIRFNYFKFC